MAAAGRNIIDAEPGEQHRAKRYADDNDGRQGPEPGPFHSVAQPPGAARSNAGLRPRSSSICAVIATPATT